MRAAALALALIAAPAAGQDLTLRVIDGDTVEAGGKQYRLANVDAPETRRAWGKYPAAQCPDEVEKGKAAKAALEALLGSGRIEIIVVGPDCGRDRTCARLEVDGADVAAIGLAEGWLKPWPHRGTTPLTDKPSWCADGEGW